MTSKKITLALTDWNKGKDYGDGFIRLSSTESEKIYFQIRLNSQAFIPQELVDAFKTHRAIQSCDGAIVISIQDTANIKALMTVDDFWFCLDDLKCCAYNVYTLDNGLIVVMPPPQPGINQCEENMVAVKKFLLTRLSRK